MIRILQFVFITILSSLTIAAMAQNSATASAATITAGTDSRNGIWTNTGFASLNDSKYASTLLSGSTNSANELDAKSWGFQSANPLLPNYIPSNAVIDGISVKVTMKKGLDGNVHTGKIRLLKAGSETGDDKAQNRWANWTTTKSSLTYGSLTDTWGTSWSAADVTNANFGVRIAPQMKGDIAVQAEVDNIEITVFFNLKKYYSKSTGDLSLTTSWGTNSDGTGLAPLTYLTPGQVFILRNRSTATLTKPLIITGANTALVVGNGSTVSFTIPKDFPYTGNMEVGTNSSVLIQSIITPTLLSAARGTTVTFENDNAQNISPISFYNLTINKHGVRTLNGSTGIENKLTINSDAVLQNNGFDVIVEGGDRALTNFGSALGAGTYAYEMENNSTDLMGKGIYDNLLINTDKRNGNATRTITLLEDTKILGNITLYTGRLKNGTKLKMEDFSKITILYGVLDAPLNASKYDVCYLLPKPVTKKMAHEMAGDPRNLIIKGTFAGIIEASKELKLSGGIHIEGSQLDVTTANYNITISGNLTGNGFINNRSNTFTFKKDNLPQVIGEGSNGYTFYNLFIDNDKNLDFKSPTTINNVFTLDHGKISTYSDAILTLGANATFLKYSDDRYINGPMAYTNASKVRRTLYFPVGKDGFYKPVSLQIAQKTTDATLYTGEFILGIPKQRVLPATEGITGFISTDRYYTVHCSNNANVDSAIITFTFDESDKITNLSNLSIVKSLDDAKWKNVKGKKQESTTVATSYLKSGSITSDPFYSFSDFRFGSNDPTINSSSSSSSSSTGTPAYNERTSTLPLKWVSVSAAQQGNSNVIKWETAEEVNVAGFVVEKSTDGRTWMSISRVAAKNAFKAIYTVTDALPETVNYYRIKQLDINGKATYSKTVQVKFNGTVIQKLSVSPNPVMGSNLSCQILDKDLLTSSEVIVKITNAAGYSVYSVKMKPEARISVSCYNLQKGYYIITVQNSNKSSYTNFYKQ